MGLALVPQPRAVLAIQQLRRRRRGGVANLHRRAGGGGNCRLAVANNNAGIYFSRELLWCCTSAVSMPVAEGRGSRVTVSPRPNLHGLPQREREGPRDHLPCAEEHESHKVGPNRGPSVGLLLGILSKQTGPCRAIWTSPVEPTLAPRAEIVPP